MEISKFITYQAAEGKEEMGIGGCGGFFGHGMRWKDYIEGYTRSGAIVVEMLRSAILKNKIRCTGEQHQYSVASVPLFDNGEVATYSFRAWGDLMAAIYSEDEDKDYSYMDFYM